MVRKVINNSFALRGPVKIRRNLQQTAGTKRARDNMKMVRNFIHGKNYSL